MNVFVSVLTATMSSCADKINKKNTHNGTKNHKTMADIRKKGKKSGTMFV